MLQQSLPFTVLKRCHTLVCIDPMFVATVLTVYGIETELHAIKDKNLYVATVLTVYGIETQYYYQKEKLSHQLGCNSPYRLRY